MSFSKSLYDGMFAPAVVKDMVLKNATNALLKMEGSWFIKMSSDDPPLGSGEVMDGKPMLWVTCP